MVRVVVQGTLGWALWAQGDLLATRRRPRSVGSESAAPYTATAAPYTATAAPRAPQKERGSGAARLGVDGAVAAAAGQGLAEVDVPGAAPRGVVAAVHRPALVGVDEPRVVVLPGRDGV